TTVTVTATNANGCSKTSDAFTTTERPAMTKPVITGASSYCPGGSVTLTATAGFTSYLWSNGMTGSSITVSSPGNYTVTVTNANGCSIASDAKSVTPYAATAITTQPASITIRRNVAASISVVATAAGSPTYQWYRGSSGDISNPVTSGGTSASLSVGTSQKGTYRYWVRVGSTTCPTSTVNSITAVVTVTN
ncbi:MAG TPA: immunoglobulin domain-containing protein, partial [Thermoanaerobaculia bacterium]